jgi:hypothetical protein
MAKKSKKKAAKSVIRIITGTDLEVHEVQDSKELNSVFQQLGIEKPVDNDAPGIQMYADDGEQFTAFVMRGGVPTRLNMSTEFHLDHNDDE